MRNMWLIIIFVFGMLIGYIYMSHRNVETKETKVEQVDTTVNQHKVVIETIKPNGTIIRKITVQTDTHQAATIIDKKESKPAPKVYVGGMISYDFSTTTPVYGIEIHKEILGPINVGVFGLTNKTVGVTFGLSL